MVREFTELQGTMGGIYAGEEGLPEAVWKAIYFHYLPVGVEADAPPSREAARRRRVDVGGGVARRQARHARRPVRGRREADRIARSVRPAPAAHGVLRVLVDLPELTGLDAAWTRRARRAGRAMLAATRSRGRRTRDGA